MNHTQPITLTDVGGMNRAGSAPSVAPISDVELFDQMALDDEEWFEPKAIYEELDKEIIGQDAAKRAAAMIIYTLFEYDMPSTNLFIGPTGCGKTEIFRQIARQWNSVTKDGKEHTFCYIFDVSHLTAEGWKGSTHLSDYMATVSSNSGSGFRKTLIVFDEFDKIYDQRNSDVNYYDMIQNNFLKLFDHDRTQFHGNLRPDDVAFVCLGAFSSIFEKKQSKKHTVGFNSETRGVETASITEEDLAAFGFKPELIGRFDRIIQMEEPTVELYRQIADRELHKLEKQLGKTIKVDAVTLNVLADEALAAQLGGRYIKHKLFAMAEDYIYSNPYCNTIEIDESPAPEM